MYSQSDIEDAVAGGALTAEQAASLRTFVATRNGVPTADEEHFRLVSGFNDIFTLVACVFALVAVGWLGSLIPLEAGRMGGPLPFQAPFAALFIAAASWGLAEIFTKQRHLALVSLVLTATFSWGVALFLVLLFLSVMAPGSPADAAIIFTLCLAAGGGAAFLHWKRFRVPVAIATAIGFGILAILALLGTLIGGGRDTVTVLGVLTLALGIGTFVYAAWWDAQDPPRFTYKSDVAFWLHWLAAGLIVNSLTQLFGLTTGVNSVGAAIGVLVLYVLFAFLALAVNRRVILLVGLVPLLSAVQSLLGGGGYRPGARYNPYGGSPYGGGYEPYAAYPVSPPTAPVPYDSYGPGYGASRFEGSYSPPSVEGTMITVLIIGAVLLLLAIYWAPVREKLVGILPEGLRRRLPPTGTATATAHQTFE